jgi:hypothetical protein
MCFWDSKGQEIDSWLTLLYQERPKKGSSAVMQ